MSDTIPAGTQPIVSTADGSVVTADAARELPPPRGRAANALWIIIVSSFCLVLLATVGALIAAMFTDATGPTRPELLLAVYTGVLGLLAGLVMPSPVHQA